MGHLNGSFAPSGGNLNKPIFKSSNARGLPGGGMLNFRIDRRISRLCRVGRVVGSYCLKISEDC